MDVIFATVNRLDVSTSESHLTNALNPTNQRTGPPLLYDECMPVDPSSWRAEFALALSSRKVRVAVPSQFLRSVTVRVAMRVLRTY